MSLKTMFGVFWRCGLPLVTGACLFGCKTLSIGESDLLRPDQGVERALREPEQRIERTVLKTEHGDLALTRLLRAGNRSVVLYFGGNQFRTRLSGGEIACGFPGDVDLVMYDYPGYGDSTGEPTLPALMASALAVYDEVVANAQSRSQRVLLYGASTGSFVAAHVAGERDPDALILEGTAPDTQQWASSFVPWFAKPFVRVQLSPELAALDNLEALAGFHGRTLLLVGTRDTQTRPRLMRRMHGALQRMGKAVEMHEFAGRGHGELLGHADVRSTIAHFIAGAANLQVAR